MDLNPSTVRPGLLVALRTTITGNVSYRKDTLADNTVDDGSQVKIWQTERTTVDPTEHDQAVKVRGKVRSLIASECALTDLGAMLCRKDNAEKLDKAIKEARKLASEFNSTAKLTRVNFRVVVAQIADTDVEAVRAINDNMRALLAEMEIGVKSLDAKAIREAASKAKSLSQMLTTEPNKRVQQAINESRKVARKLVKAGEVAAREIDSQAMASLLYARTALVDLDEAAPIGEVEGEQRALDLSPERDTGWTTALAKPTSIELP